MLVEIGCGLGRSTQSHTVNKVVGYHGVDRSDINFRRIAGLYKVFDECLCTEDDILEALDVLQSFDEGIHGILAFG